MADERTVECIMGALAVTMIPSGAKDAEVNEDRERGPNLAEAVVLNFLDASKIFVRSPFDGEEPASEKAPGRG